MNHDERSLDDFNPSLQQIPIPEEFNQRIMNTLKRASAKQKRRKSLRRGGLAFVAAIAASALLIILSPPIASFAKNIPGLQSMVQHLEQWGPYSGISVAKSNGYVPIDPVTVSYDGISVTIDNVYFEENQLLFTASVSSEAIQQYLRTAKGGPEAGSLGVNMISMDFQGEPGVTSKGTTSGVVYQSVEDLGIDEQDNSLYAESISAEVAITQAEYDAFMNSQPTHLTFQLRQFIYGDSDPATIKEFQFEVPFDAAHIQAAKKIAVRSDLKLGSFDSDISASVLDRIIIAPTRMSISLSTSLKSTGSKPFYLGSGVDQETQGAIDFISLWSELDNKPYLTDRNGKKYETSDSTMSYASTSRELRFTPSLYFDKDPELQLHISKVWVSGPVADSINLSLKDSFPKTISFRGKPLTILQAKYEKGYLVLTIKRDEEAIPFNYYSTKSAEESHRISGGTLLLMSDYWKELQSPDGDKRLFEQYFKDSIWGLLGQYVPNVTDKQLGKDQYEVKVPAPEQTAYHLEGVRYYDPVEVNMMIPIPLK